MSEPQTRSSNPTPFVLPLIIFLLIAMFYPDFADSYEGRDDEFGNGLITAETWQYLIMIAIQVIVATGLIVFFRKVYIEHFPLKFSPLAVVVGVVGVVLWIGVCQLNLEPRLLSAIGLDFGRPAFNPAAIEDHSIRLVFLSIRFALLAIIVPVIEELFLRGWLVRWVQDPNFENVSLKGLSLGALLAASGYGVVTHPSEAIAAFLWFGLVTWLMNRTGNLWDCVVAHSVTNLLLGIYILQTGAWELW